MRRLLLAFVCLLGVSWVTAQVWLACPPNEVLAQDKAKAKASKKKGNSSVLDVKANEIQGDFIKSAEELASEYYDLKEYDKARVLLKSIQALDPNRPKLAEKLKLLDEDMINSNESEFEVNTSHGWDSSGVMAFAGKPIRLKSEGTYKFVVSAQLNPAGFALPAASIPADMVHELPMGALIGIIIPNERPPQSGKVDDKKREKPFLIGEGCDYTSQKDGVLYLRVNAPAENKNTGKIKVQISGGVRLGKT